MITIKQLFIILACFSVGTIVGVFIMALIQAGRDN